MKTSINIINKNDYFIYKHPEWPSLYWDTDIFKENLEKLKEQEIKLSLIIDKFKVDILDNLKIISLSNDIAASWTIDGEFINLNSIRSIFAKKLSINLYLNKKKNKDQHHINDIVEIFLDINKNSNKYLTQERLFQWHKTIVNNNKDYRPGSWRLSEDDDTHFVHTRDDKIIQEYKVVDAAKISSEVDIFLNWFNTNTKIEPIIRAAVSNLWFIIIHPFLVGNGRISRAISDLALSQNNPLVQFYSISNQLLYDKFEYYEYIKYFQKSTDLNISKWISWYIDESIKSVEYTLKEYKNLTP
jgi:Fic family protein